MKKISILSLHLGYGGIEKSIVNLANILVDNYDIEIISTYKLEDTPAFDINDKVKVKYLYNKYRPNKEEWIKSIKKFNIIKFVKETYKAIMVLINKKNKTINAIKNCDSDIIISTRDIFNKWLGEYGSKKSYKIAWEHNHYHDDKKYLNKIVDSCKNIDSLVLVSESLKNVYKNEMKKKKYKCKCFFIPNMLDSIPNKTSNLKEKKFVTIGRLSKEKGYTDLIDIFKEFNNKYKNNDWVLDIIGDGPERNKIVDKIYEYKLTDKIKVRGFLKKEEVYNYLNNSSVYLMTSYTESFGIVLIEAMSNKLPCISFTSAEGANDLIKNNYNGFLIKDRNLTDYVDKMIILADSYSKRLKLGENAYKFSFNYTSDKVKEDWINLLKRKV